VVVETLADRRVLSEVRDVEALLGYLSAAIAEAAGAPRSAERSAARRRLLQALPDAVAAVVASTGRGDRTSRWFEDECRQAVNPDVRQALSRTLIALRAHGQSATSIDALRKALESSAKPLRDPSRLRPGTGRGKASRRVR
jgi:hypothetical protein